MSFGGQRSDIFRMCSGEEVVLPFPAGVCSTGLGGSDMVRLCPGGGGGGLFFRVELPPPPLVCEVRGRDRGGLEVGPEGRTNR